MNFDIPGILNKSKFTSDFKSVWKRFGVKAFAKGTNENNKKAAEFWVYEAAVNRDNQWKQTALNGPNPKFPIVVDP